jgi:transposase
MARPTKLSPELEERIVRAVRAGNHVEPACRSAGIGPSTYYRWLERGEREREGPYAEFRAAVRRAEAEAEVHAVAVIRKAMTDDWRAALAYLERRHPGRWRRREALELEAGAPGPPAGERLDLKRLRTADLALLEELRSRAAVEA